LSIARLKPSSGLMLGFGGFHSDAVTGTSELDDTADNLVALD